MEHYKLVGLEGYDTPPDSAGGRAEVVQPVREKMPNPNTIEGMIAAYGVIADGAHEKGWRRNGAYFMIAIWAGPFIVAAVALLVRLLF